MASYRPAPLARAWLAAMDHRTAPLIVLGDFLDDWRRVTDPAERARLITGPLPDSPDPELHRWAAFAAATVEHLCRRDGVPVPAWVEDPRWILPEPWFLEPYWKLRPWILAATPPSWKRRRIFGGDETTLIGRV